MPRADRTRAIRILLLGSASGYNHGDVAILEANMGMVLERMPGAVFVIPSSAPQDTRSLFAEFPVTVVGTQRLRFLSRSVVREALQCDVAMTCAGIFFDYLLGDIRYNFVSSLTPLLALCRLQGMPVVGFNVGIQRPTSRAGRHLMRACLALHNQLFVRDPGDAQVLAELYVPTPVAVTVDSAIVGPAASSQGDRSALPCRGAEREPVIAVNLTHKLALPIAGQPPPMDRPALLAHFAETLREVHERTNARLLLVATERRDHKLLQELKENGDLVSECVLAPFLDHRTTRAVLGSCDFLVGARLHALVLGCRMGTPFAAIPCQQKVGGFARMVGLGERFLLHGWWRSPEHLASAIVRAFRDRASARERIRQFLRDAPGKAGLAADWLARRHHARHVR